MLLFVCQPGLDDLPSLLMSPQEALVADGLGLVVQLIFAQFPLDAPLEDGGEDRLHAFKIGLVSLGSKSLSA